MKPSKTDPAMEKRARKIAEEIVSHYPTSPFFPYLVRDALLRFAKEEAKRERRELLKVAENHHDICTACANAIFNLTPKGRKAGKK